MSKRKHFFTIGKLMGLYGLALSAFFLFDAGMDANRHHFFQMALDFLIASFGFGFLTIMWMESVDKAQDEVRDLYIKEAKGKLDKIFEQAKDFANKEVSVPLEAEHDIELALAIAKDILQGEQRQATPAEVARIEQAFHDQSDGHYLKIHMSNTDGMEMEVSTSPIESEPVKSLSQQRREAAMAAPSRKVIPVKDGNEKPARKPRMTAKRKAAIAAEEAAAQREVTNARRRAARAAKKAELKQTSLI